MYVDEHIRHKKHTFDEDNLMNKRQSEQLK